MPIPGLMLYGANVLLTSEDESAVSNEPVWLSSDVIELAIERGLLTDGSLDNFTVRPPVSEWPESWRHLKLKE